MEHKVAQSMRKQMLNERVEQMKMSKKRSRGKTDGNDDVDVDRKENYSRVCFDSNREKR